MTLLFVAGVMNLAWVALIAGFILIEKLVPRGLWVGRVAGAALMIWGVAILAGRFR
jgi:predicted metal-binding membrane protein